MHVLRWKKVCVLAGWDGEKEPEGRICFWSLLEYSCMSCSFLAGWANLYLSLAVSLEVQHLQIDHQPKKYHVAVPLHNRCLEIWWSQKFVWIWKDYTVYCIHVVSFKHVCGNCFSDISSSPHRFVLTLTLLWWVLWGLRPTRALYSQHAVFPWWCFFDE